jgi:hypothetical protein
LLNAGEWESALWWVMLASGLTAAALSIATTALDRGKAAWPTHRQRFQMHLASYGLLTISIVAFILRGLLQPT